MVTFLKKALEITYTKDYELIWKWPDIAHDDLIKSLSKVKGILNKMGYPLKIMSNDFKAEYGPYSMNITNTQTINSLKDYELITLSPELRKKDYEDIIKDCEDNSKIELLVQGSVELMKTRYGFKEKIDNANLTDNQNDHYPIKYSLTGEELIIFNSKELSLIDEIEYLASIGYVNFSIDGRFKNKDYINMIDLYKDALNANVKNKNILRNITKGNY